MIRKDAKGFTIVELMIATAVFSIVLLLCSFAIIHVGRLYYKGMITTRTQDVSRKVADDVARSIQFGSTGSDITPENSANFGSVRVYSRCIAGVRYSFSKEFPLGDGPGKLPHVLWKDRLGVGQSCDPRDITQDEPGGDGGVELLGENMRVPEFDVNEIGDGTWDIVVRVVYGEDESLFEDGTGYSICKGSNAGGQFCAVSQFKTTVGKRL